MTRRSALSPYHIRVADDLDALGVIWPTTRDCGLAHCFPFQRREILQIWCDTIGRATEIQPLFVAIHDELERPVLLLPLGIRRHRGLRILQFLDGGANDYNAPVVFEPARNWPREIVNRLWQDLVGSLPRFDVAILEKMPENIYGVPNPLAALGHPFGSGNFLRLQGSWEQYAADRLPFRRESIIQRRRLGKVGQLALMIAETSSDRRRVLEIMLRQKSRRYVETSGYDGLERPGFRQYYVTMVERLDWPGSLLMCALEVDDTIIATNWGFMSNGNFLGIITSFEGDQWKRYSPGRLLLEDLLKWQFTNLTTVFDFGSGNESYKLGYCNESVALYRATIPITLMGKAYTYQLGRNSHSWRLFRRCMRIARYLCWRSSLKNRTLASNSVSEAKAGVDFVKGKN